VPRPRLVRRLLGSSDTPLVLLVAPAGYGKTTLLAQWAGEDRRPFAWITLDEDDNDPRRLLSSVASVTADRQGSFVLVLDDAHVLRSRGSLDVIQGIVSQLPFGSQLALASRDEPRMRVGRLRANRDVVELRFGDLVMTPSEGAALLRATGAELGAGEVDTIMLRTEGWPAGLYLAALSLGESVDSAACTASFGGDHRLVTDYLRDEVLSELAADRIAFLTRVAVLERLAGPLCDAVLGRSGCGRVLADLERRNLLVFAAEDAGWYRCHPLLSQMLRAELRRSEPELEPELHRRAAAWYSRNGQPDAAIRHAIAARDAALSGELLWANLPRLVNYGRNARVQRWLEQFSDDEVARHPALALVAAGSQLVGGDRNLMEHWAAAAAHGLADVTGDGSSSLSAGLSMLKASIAPDGIGQMREDATRAYELSPDDSPWRSICCLLVGAARHLSGDRGGARGWLEEGARRGAVGAPSIQALCLAQLALVAIEESDWINATSHALRARSQAERFGLGEYPTAALVFAVSASVWAQAGRVDEAKVDARRATDLASRLTDFAFWYEIEVHVSLARAALRLSDVLGARGHMAVASGLLRRSPDAAVLGEWMEEPWARLDAAPRNAMNGRWSLTTAELRVLQFLPTHLSFPEIARRLNVSANTVKTHSRAVYRKLDASSRAEAVARARTAGLIDASPIVLAAA
jgi:LuxR family transcriptional regulator, maltose regulon positive regulatory protein